MNLIDKQLVKIKQGKRLGLMTHLVVGYPTLKTSEKLVKVMEDAGADFIELQIPFSDPLADGPTIMKASEMALQNGVKVKDAFTLASKMSKQINIPLIFMAYFNTIFKYGTKRFCIDAKKAGISGLIIPDVPIEEEHEEHFIKYCKQAGLKNIRVISPASTEERLKKNAKIADGFIYCTSRQGITGVGKKLDPNLAKYLNTVKKHFKIPIAVGFGISNAEQVNALKDYADIIVTGSAIIEIINKSNKEDLEKNIKDFISKLRDMDQVINYLMNSYRNI